MPKLESTAKRIEHVASRLPEAAEMATKAFAETLARNSDSTVKNAIAVTNRNADKVFVAQTAELRVAAKAIFDEQLGPPLLKLTAQLHGAIRQSQDPWNRWLTHAATAVVAACLPTALLLALTSPAPAKGRPTAEAPACVQQAPAAAEPATALPASKPRARR